MSEWPEQKRLTNALNRMADSAKVDGPHRQAVMVKMLETQPVAANRITGQFSRLKLLATRTNLRFASVATAATMIVAAVGGVTIAGRQLSPSETRVEAMQATEGSQSAGSEPDAEQGDRRATAPRPTVQAPKLTQATLCDEQSPGPLETEFVVAPAGHDEVTIGVQATDGRVVRFGAVSFIDFGSSSDWVSGRQLDVLGTSEVSLAYRLPALPNLERALATMDSIVNSACHASLFASVQLESMPGTAAIACVQGETGRTISGVLLIGPGRSPATCPGSTPTQVVTTGFDEETSGWSASHRCEGPARRPLTTGATLITFNNCQKPLAIVDLKRPIDDLWVDPDLAGAVANALLKLR